MSAGDAALKEPHKYLAEFRETRAKSLLDKHIDSVRLYWAKEWFYYGNDPVEPDRTQFRLEIEREIWALWIMTQDYQAVISKVRRERQLRGDIV
jgi:hypothetical protein